MLKRKCDMELLSIGMGTIRLWTFNPLSYLVGDNSHFSHCGRDQLYPMFIMPSPPIEMKKLVSARYIILLYTTRGAADAISRVLGVVQPMIASLRQMNKVVWWNCCLLRCMLSVSTVHVRYAGSWSPLSSYIQMGRTFQRHQ